MSFNLSWWAFVFPNAGFTLATIQIANGLDSAGIKWVTSVMTIMLFATWIFVGIAMLEPFGKSRYFGLAKTRKRA
jgi:tellurite resistance protein TehA-like permease